MVISDYYYVIDSVIFGIIGGFAHDIIQNKRIWQPPVKKNGDTYLGSIAGLILGGISGLIVGLALPLGTSPINAASSALTAGIALKGLAEAYTTEQPPKDQAEADKIKPTK